MSAPGSWRCRTATPVPCPAFNRWAMDRLGEMVRSAVRAVRAPTSPAPSSQGALRHAGEAAYIRGALLDPRRLPTEGKSA